MSRIEGINDGQDSVAFVVGKGIIDVNEIHTDRMSAAVDAAADAASKEANEKKAKATDRAAADYAEEQRARALAESAARKAADDAMLVTFIGKSNPVVPTHPPEERRDRGLPPAHDETPCCSLLCCIWYCCCFGLCFDKPKQLQSNSSRKSLLRDI